MSTPSPPPGLASVRSLASRLRNAGASPAFLVAMALLVGVGAGLGAVAFRWLVTAEVISGASAAIAAVSPRIASVTPSLAPTRSIRTMSAELAPSESPAQMANNASDPAVEST